MPLGKTNRDKTYMTDGDVFLVARLKYRGDGIKISQRELDASEFEFFKGSYAQA